MKTLYFVRHAKSSWKHDVTDHQRPLKGRGKKDAPLVAKEVANMLTAPQKIITSDAVRAKTTAHYFREAFQVPDTDYSTNNQLYDFSGQQVMQVIGAIDDSLDCVMLVGHNHAFTSIVNMLGNVYIDNLPTSGFVSIAFDTESWKTITTGTTTHKVFPRDLK